MYKLFLERGLPRQELVQPQGLSGCQPEDNNKKAFQECLSSGIKSNYKTTELDLKRHMHTSTFFSFLASSIVLTGATPRTIAKTRPTHDIKWHM